MPIVVSVPKNTKCLSGADTIIFLEAVGALLTRVALVFVAPDALASHSKVSPLKIEANNLLPKLSSVHKPGSVIISPDAAAFHAKKLDASVTVAPVSYTHLTLPTILRV